MRSFKFFWNAHKWTGIVLSGVFVYMAATGFLLLMKKRSGWIQSPTRSGAAGEVADFIGPRRLFEVILDQDHPDFRSAADVERVDLRPHDRVFRVHSEHHHSEMQICAVTGEVLEVSWRRSDLIEDIHDGSFFADWYHDWAMPGVSGALSFMAFSGWWLWLAPKLRRRRRMRAGTSGGRG